MTTQRAKAAKTRQPHQRKPIKKGVKSRRGCPELYDELKQPTTVGLTKTALQGLDELSAQRQLSRSELIERVGRKLIELVVCEPAPLTPEVQQ